MKRKLPFTPAILRFGVQNTKTGMEKNFPVLIEEVLQASITKETVSNPFNECGTFPWVSASYFNTKRQTV